MKSKTPSFQLGKSVPPRELLQAEYTTIFQVKKRYIRKLQTYYINYIKINIDKLRQIKGNAKEKIHDAMVEIYRQNQTGIKIESIDCEIDYRDVLLVLTANGFVYENSTEIYRSILNEFEAFLAEIIEEGQKNRKSVKTSQPKTL